MAVDRGVSTVLDVGLACLLVTASATLLVTTPTMSPDPPDADRIGRAILPSTIVVEDDGHTVETSVGDLLATAAHHGTITREARTAIRERIQTVHPRTSIVATVVGGPSVAIGREPAAGLSVDAAVFRVGPAGVHDSSSAATGSIVIVVRSWSP